jgi:hypothetical protein
MTAAHAADLFDRYEGTQAFPMRNKEKVYPSEVVPIGSINMVTFRVTRTGAIVIVRASGRGGAVDYTSLLPIKARQLVQAESAP